MLTETLLTRTKQFLKDHDLRARKGLAQHFLVDGSYLKKIIAAAELTPADTVIEVGPGLGILTLELAKVARKVIAIELDRRMAEILQTTTASSGNVVVVNEDILKADTSGLVAGNYKVVANLPYYITSAVIRHFLESCVKPSLMVLMVQKEVAKVITSPPGEMSLLSVSVQLYGEPKIVTKVPARSFYPAPDVDSAVLKIRVYEKTVVDTGDIPGFFKLVKAGFSANRKQIVNPLSKALSIDKAEIIRLLRAGGIDPTRRAETLSVSEWKQLFEMFKSEGKLSADD